RSGRGSSLRSECWEKQSVNFLVTPQVRPNHAILPLMVRITVLASGSRGNSALIASSRTRILVDAGLSARETVRRRRLGCEDPAALTAILISHEHSDHVAGLRLLARKLEIPVYMT